MQTVGTIEAVDNVLLHCRRGANRPHACSHDAHARTNASASTRTHTLKYTHSRTHPCTGTHARMRARTHANTRVHEHTHTHAQTLRCPLGRSRLVGAARGVAWCASHQQGNAHRRRVPPPPSPQHAPRTRVRWSVTLFVWLFVCLHGWFGSHSRREQSVRALAGTVATRMRGQWRARKPARARRCAAQHGGSGA